VLSDGYSIAVVPDQKAIDLLVYIEPIEIYRLSLCHSLPIPIVKPYTALFVTWDAQLGM